MKSFRLPKSGWAGCYLSGALCLADMELARSHVQYPVTYMFPEWGRKQTKGVSSVTLTKKKEDYAPDSVQAMNGITFTSIWVVVLGTTVLGYHYIQ